MDLTLAIQQFSTNLVHGLTLALGSVLVFVVLFIAVSSYRDKKRQEEMLALWKRRIG